MDNLRPASTHDLSPQNSPIRALIPRLGRQPARTQRGFTLFELLIVTIVTGLLGVIWASENGGAFTAAANAHDAEQEALNKRLASVMLDYAASISPTGDLPAVYTSGSINKALPLNDTNLNALLVQARIRPSDAQDDGSAGQNVRVYQKASPLNINLPLYTTFGPSMTLTYAEAVIYATQCRRGESCNSTPGASGTFDTTTLTTFVLATPDYGLARFSTLAIQKQKLAQTADTIDLIRTRIQEYYREKQRNALASDTTNFYPRPVPIVGSSYKTNDCNNDGWYPLDTTNILTQLGLTPTVQGRTAWGGTIFYCADYDPTQTGTAYTDTPPHFAALRILTNPSSGGSATATNATATVIPL